MNTLRTILLLSAASLLAACGRSSPSAPPVAGKPAPAAPAATAKPAAKPSKDLIDLATLGIADHPPAEKTAAAASATASIRALRSAAEDLRTGRAARAIELLKKLQVPEALADRREALLLSAMIATRPAAQVIAEANRFAKERGDDPQALLVAGVALAHVKDYDHAGALIDHARDLAPGSALPWVAHGDLEALLGHRQAAASAFKHALEDDPRNPGALEGEAQIALDNGNAALAAQDLETLRKASPESLKARVGLARLYLAAGDLARAAGPLQEARALAPSDPSVQFLLAAFALDQGHAQEAVASFQSLTARYPSASLLEQYLARAYALAGRAGEARAAAAHAVELAPHDWRAISTQATIALQQRDRQTLTTVLPALESAAARSPSGVLAENIAAVRSALGASDPERPLRDWLARDPKDIGVRLNLAQQLMQAGQQGPAAQQYETILQQAPNQVIALNNLAWLRLQAGQKAQALDLARRAYALAPKVADVADTYGWALLQTGDTKDALPPLQAASRGAPGDVSVRLHLAVALLRTGEKEQARQALREVIAAEPHGGPEASEASRLLGGT